MAVDVQRMFIETQIDEVEDGGIDEVPVLYFTTPHHDAGATDTVDQKRALGRGTVSDLGERLEHACCVGDGRLEHEHALRGGGDLGNLVDFPLDDQRAGHAAADLDGGRSVQMRVIPIRARRVIEADAVFVLPNLSGLDTESRIVHDEIAIDTGCNEPWGNVQAVCMQVCAVGIAQMLRGFDGRRIRRQLIHHQDSQRVTDLDAQRGGGNAVVH